MIKDILPSQINYHQKGQDTKKQNLKINYGPLFSEEGLLTKIMFIVEDITEFQKLEEEMEKQKEEEMKNLEVLQELASNKKEDLTHFFKESTKAENRILEESKELRSHYERGYFKTDLTELFRTLHTLKGNSRLFNLSMISSKVHELENPVTKLIQNREKNDIVFNVNQINELISGTYDFRNNKPLFEIAKKPSILVKVNLENLRHFNQN